MVDSFSALDQVKRIFRKHDSRGDGYIGIGELSMLLKALQCFDDQEAEAFIAYIDKTDDGRIRYADFLNWVFGKPPQLVAAEQVWDDLLRKHVDLPRWILKEGCDFALRSSCFFGELARRHAASFSPLLHTARAPSLVQSLGCILRSVCAAGALSACDGILRLFDCVAGKPMRHTMLLSQDRAGYSALHKAGSAGHAAVARMLLDCCPDPQGLLMLRSKHGWPSFGKSAFHCCALGGHASVAKLLVDRAPDAQQLLALADNDGNSGLLGAAFEGHLPVVQLVLEKASELKSLCACKDKYGNSALHKAAFQGHAVVALLLLDAAPEPQVLMSTCDVLGSSPLHKAALRGHVAVVRLLLGRVPDVLSYVVMQNRDGWSALHYAAFGGHTSVVQAFLGRCPPNDARSLARLRNSGGDTAVRLAEPGSPTFGLLHDCMECA